MRFGDNLVPFLRNEIAMTASAPNNATKVGLNPSNNAQTIAAKGTKNKPPFFMVSDRGGTALLSSPLRPNRTEV